MSSRRRPPLRPLVTIAVLSIAAQAVAAPPARPQAFARCAVCHPVTPGAAAGIGPNLSGVAGAKAGKRPGYAYSPALTTNSAMWDKATLTRWLIDPRMVAPGTTMPAQALSPAERDAIVAYLLTLKK